MKINLEPLVKFENRHIGPTNEEISLMLNKIKAASLEELIDQTIPKSIQLPKTLNLPKAQTEAGFLRNLRVLAKKK